MRAASALILWSHVCVEIDCVFNSTAKFLYSNSQPNTFSLIKPALECEWIMVLIIALTEYGIYTVHCFLSIMFEIYFIYIYNSSLYISCLLVAGEGEIFAQSFLGSQAWKRYRERSQGCLASANALWVNEVDVERQVQLVTWIEYWLFSIFSLCRWPNPN